MPARDNSDLTALMGGSTVWPLMKFFGRNLLAMGRMMSRRATSRVAGQGTMQENPRDTASVTEVQSSPAQE